MRADRRGFLKLLGGGAAAVATKEFLPLDRIELGPTPPPAVESVRVVPRGVPVGWTTTSTSAAGTLIVGDYAAFYLRPVDALELSYA